MESTQKLQFLTEEIQRLIEEKKNQEEEAFGVDSIPLDHTDRPILSRLLSELESLKGDGTLKQSGSSSDGESKLKSTRKAGLGQKATSKGSRNKDVIDVEEIGKEIKKVKRQNFITHCLLSALIVVTVAWQVSEVSLALSIKDKLSHPVKSLASALFGGGRRNQCHDRDGQDQERSHQETNNGSTMMIPELPRVDFSFSGDDNS
ncbi:hypothetical protein LINPERPRIM_LOCUS28994 [Linum perenne]